MKLKAGADGKAQVTVRGKGTRLVLPALGSGLSLPIVAQLQGSNGQCWTATHDVSGVQFDTDVQFKGKGS